MTVIWTDPLEAVNDATGEVREVTLDARCPQPDHSGDYAITPRVDEYSYFKADGSPYARSNPWRIRNRAKPAGQLIPVGLQQRVVALIEQVVATAPRSTAQDRWYDEALALAALLKPVDPDLVEARRIAADTPDEGSGRVSDEELRDGKRDTHVVVRIALAALKRGRELQQQETPDARG